MLHTYSDGSTDIICDRCFANGMGTIKADGVYRTGKVSRAGQSELCRCCADDLEGEKISDIDEREVIRPRTKLYCING